MKGDKKPLYRKFNTCSHHMHDFHTPDSKYDRHTKNGVRKSMESSNHIGYDFKPLYKFLLSKVGEDFDVVYSEAISRLPITDFDAIYHIVAECKQEIRECGYVRIGESSYYSQLMVDENNKLVKVKPDLLNIHLKPSCWCCTHTFNGEVFINKYDGRYDKNFRKDSI